MKATLPRALVLPALFLTSMSPLLAHPGHDDGHELTWELSHWATHPFVTAAWVVVIVAAGLTTLMLTRRASAEPAQSFRGSQARRGK